MVEPHGTETEPRRNRGRIQSVFVGSLVEFRQPLSELLSIGAARNRGGTEAEPDEFCRSLREN